MITPLSKNALSVLLAISGLLEVKYMYLMIIYSANGIVNIAEYCHQESATEEGSKRLNLIIR